MSCCHDSGINGTCVECDVPQLARNNYFTGKLLVERDFTDEQRYFIGKHRRHAARLHGWGTVCGLKVKQHPNPGCRNQYVLIEPGMAVDCCGREIVVAERQYFDFRRAAQQMLEQNGQEGGPGDDNSHTLQICLRYAECPTEDVPALFDECGCNDIACQPNRILESFALDVRLDPPPRVENPVRARLDWRSTVNIAHALRVAVDDAHHKLYVISADDPATLAVLDGENSSLIRSRSVDGQVMDLALSPNGERVYVAVEDAGLKVLVLNAALDNPAVNTLPIPDSADNSLETLSLAVARNGRLYVLATTESVVYAWDTPDTGDTVDMLTSAALGTNPSALVVTPDDGRVIAANPDSANLSVLDAMDLTAAPRVVNLPGASPSALAVGHTSTSNKLYVADTANKTLRILEIPVDPADPYAPLGSLISLVDEPVKLAAGGGDRWIYVLGTAADGKGWVQVVDAHRVEAGSADVMGARVSVGDAPRDLAVGAHGLRLYAAFASVSETGGGVAIVDVTPDECDEILLRALDACPECDGQDCIVLATVRDFVVGSEITDERLDNLSDRQLLPSTSLLMETIQCLLQRGVGEPGEPGATGPTGPRGPGIDDVQVEMIDCDEDPKAEILEGHILHLKLPCDCKDKTPEPVAYTRICGINWRHGDTMKISDLRGALMVNFSAPVRLGDFLNLHVFTLMTNSSQDDNLMCWCEIPPKGIIGANLDLRDNENGTCDFDPAQVPEEVQGADAMVRTVLFVPSTGFVSGHEYRVIIKGDFIRDGDWRAVDANHLPGWLPNRVTGDGVEGGTFESWFTAGDDDRTHSDRLVGLTQPRTRRGANAPATRRARRPR